MGQVHAQELAAGRPDVSHFLRGASPDNDEAGMSHDQRMTKSEGKMGVHRTVLAVSDFRDWDFLRHSTFGIRISHFAWLFVPPGSGRSDL